MENINENSYNNNNNNKFNSLSELSDGDVSTDQVVRESFSLKLIFSHRSPRCNDNWTLLARPNSGSVLVYWFTRE